MTEGEVTRVWAGEVTEMVVDGRGSGRVRAFLELEEAKVREIDGVAEGREGIEGERGRLEEEEEEEEEEGEGEGTRKEGREGSHKEEEIGTEELVLLVVVDVVDVVDVVEEEAIFCKKEMEV